MGSVPKASGSIVIRSRKEESVTQSNPFAAGVPVQAPPAQPNPFAAPPAPAPAPQPQQPMYAPPAAPAPAPQYAPPQQQAYAPPAPQTQQAPPPALDPNALRAAPPPVVGEGKGAKLADMYGRLVLVFPQSLTRTQRRPEHITAEDRINGNTMQDQLTATIVVLDAGPGRMDPIAFGGAPHKLPPIPHTESAPLPYVRKSLWINQSRLISQLRDFLPAQPGGVPGMTVGRVTKAGPNNNDPWFLIAANEQELALAGQYLTLVAGGQYPHPLA